jgi:hypothetical protein
MSDDVTGLGTYFLSRLRGPDPETALHAMESAILGYPHQHPGLVQLAADLAEDASPAAPRDPDAQVWCSWCGAPGDLAAGGLEPGPDEPYFGGKADRFCADQDACVQNRSNWYPPDWSKVPLWLSSVNEQADAGEIVRLAADQAARSWLAELSQRPDTGVLELSGTGGGTDPDALPAPPWQPVFAHYDPWHHVVGKLHNRGHLISGQGGGLPMGQGPGVQPQRLPDKPAPRRRGRRRGRR